MSTIPEVGQKLTPEQVETLKALAKSGRRTIIEMVKQSQSGHPGGSLSCIDYLTLLYAGIIGRNGENVVVSNGHISPAVYSVLAEMGYIPKEDVIKTFRKINSIYEGHVTRHVRGVTYGTGPLGVGVSVSAAFALAEKLKDSNKKVFALMGDGEAQEGQVYEMMLFAGKYKLDNLILFVDYNQVQLTASLEEVMPIDIKGIFQGGHWEVLETDGHDFEAIWDTIGKAYQVQGKPVVIIGHTVMGKGVEFMEAEGRDKKSTWHGNAPKPEQADAGLKEIELTEQETALTESFRKNVTWQPPEPHFTESLTEVKINTGTPRLYTLETLTDCRSAYGQALLDLADVNPQILALTADLRGSVMTKMLAAKYDKRHIECGIAEQNMVSVSGGLSLQGFIPFCSTFGAFMSSRAKDQARVNDINRCNVKMVATHCGLSVGEDGPTHQAIDDAGSFLGMFNTMVIEPADPNHTDRIIRYLASHWGNFYVRMGRHKFPVITKEDGTPFYGADYVYEYGKCDLLREGTDVTIAATGASITEALKARENLKKSKPELSVEVVAVSSIKQFDATLINSIKKTKKVITVEDHNTLSGLGGQLARHLEQQHIAVDQFTMVGVTEYQLSGKVDELYAKAGINAEAIEKACGGR